MEVDLWEGDARLAIELGGAEHLDALVACCRDRRKDMLLQEDGCIVLQFLAEDVGTRLNEVLDAILQALGYRGKRFSQA